MSDQAPQRDDDAMGPRWALVLAWIGIIWGICGILQIVFEYRASPFDTSDYLFPGLIHVLLGFALAVFCMRKRLKG